MELDILQIDSGIYRGWDGHIKPTLNLRVVPSDSDRIQVGEWHGFADHAVRLGDKRRIDAHIRLVSSESELAWAKDQIAVELLEGVNMAGFAKANFAEGKDGEASLYFFIFVDDINITELSRQLQGVGTGDVTANIDLEGLDSGSFDENVWTRPEGPKNFAVLPITSWNFRIRQLVTTRHAIRDQKDKLADTEDLDSDDIETVKRTVRWIKENEARNPDPLLKTVQGMRLALFVLTALVAMLVYYSRN